MRSLAKDFRHKRVTRIRSSFVSVVIFVLILINFSTVFSAIGTASAYTPSSSTVVPQGVIKYFSVTIINNQFNSTPTPFVQKVDVESFLFSNYEASNLQNVVWFTANGTIIPSFIGTNLSANALETTYWLRMPFGIPELSEATIYIGFENQSVNLFGQKLNEGVAPELTSTYGQYDNGQLVFNSYWNFAVSAPGWKLIGGKIADGLTLNRAQSGCAYYNVSANFNGTVEMLVDQMPGGSNSYAYSQVGLKGNTPISWSEPALNFVPSNCYIYPADGYIAMGTPRQFFSVYAEPAGYFNLTGVSTNSSFYYNGNLVFTNSNYKVNQISSIYLFTGGTSGTDLKVDYVFVMPNLPDGIMPQASVQSPPYIHSVGSSASNMLMYLLLGLAIGIAGTFSVVYLIGTKTDYLFKKK